MKKLLILVVLILVGCSSNSLESRYGLNEMDIQEIVHELNFNVELKNDVSASINGTTLTVKSSDEVLTYDVGDEFYLAVAPYINYTHTWTFHSITGCSAELASKEMQVTLTDNNGTVIVDKILETLPNGFFELWLPREIEGVLTVEYEGLSATTTVSTYETDLTCLATMELK